jgi:pimeloyl-ACP methyl ester carboxylesterase
MVFTLRIFQLKIGTGSSTMPKAKANGIQIEYETFGNPTAPPLLLIMGLGGQLIHWDQELCKQFAGNGHFVIRFDNRDSGLSTKFDEAGLPDMSELFNKISRGEAIETPYTFNDLADDAAGLLDALDVNKAHICGASMGGMIAQTLAIRHPQRVLSLISIYSTTGNPELPQPQTGAMEVLMMPPPSERQAFIDHTVKTLQIIAGSGFPFDENYVRNIAAESYDRCFYPQGVTRQLTAVLTQENRKSALASLSAPTLVIHGTDDPLVPVECGKDTADAIPGSELLIIEGMGHDLPHKGDPWTQIVEAVSVHTEMVKARSV